ncbi:MAG: 30S ribosomal protein S12 methylthiotransferase RimO [Deltaproteobacteria bacterium]|nr:MAG: 30S ribosomal protein S12 methylthiotransferase RimO [Deltaproteobacteria bacterium]
MAMSEQRKIYVVSLGCPKNLVDTEHMLGILTQEGYGIAEEVKEADLALVNTCSFIAEAVKEAVDTILTLADLRKTSRLKRLIVAGCLVQRYGYKLKKEIPEVDIWLGTGLVGRIGKLIRVPDKIFSIERPIYLADHSVPRLRCTPFFTAYLRIAEGCSHKCSFCIIPKLRGPYRSRTIDSLLSEAEKMASEGVKEVNLVAQDITAYGSDLGMKWGLETLLERLSQIKGIQWIRLLYGYPGGITERLLDLMETVDLICPYLDIPLQHVNKGILSAMGRASEESPRQLVEQIRKRDRDIAIRTTLMVGFPGETHQIFRELWEFVRWAQFDHLGVFAYSKEKGTRAAKLHGEVPPSIAEGRRDEIMALQAEISLQKNRAKIGQKLSVLIEGFSEETDLLLKGRTATMAPEVDGQVLINRGVGEEGKIMAVRITEAYHYDLVGEIIE